MNDTDENEKQRKHLSASQLEMFAKCPESWRRRYIEKEVIPPRLAMLKGSALHKAAEHNMRQKMQTREDLMVDEIVDFAVNAFEEGVKGGYQLADNESKAEVGDYKKLVDAMATTHAEWQAPDYQPVAVEEKFVISLPSIEHDIVGVIDLVDESGAVIDFKTSSKKMTEADVDTSIQLGLYAAAQNKNEVAVKLDVLIEPSARLPSRRQLIEGTRDNSDLPVIAKRVAVVSKTIEAGLFPPAPVGSWWCSESWCGYWNTCPYVNSERIANSKEVKKAMAILEGKKHD